MDTPEVIVVRTGTANLASIVAGLQRAGAAPRVSEQKKEIEDARLLVLPGVGTLAAAMERLRAAELVEPLRERIRKARPTLAVCLGLQMLCESSEESPDFQGLSIVPGHIVRFPKGLRVPQLGWNEIAPDDGARLLEQGYVYFANSYCLRTKPDGWNVAMSDYGGPFVAALERGAVLACQFHPELSSDFGIDLIRRWIENANDAGDSLC